MRAETVAVKERMIAEGMMTRTQARRMISDFHKPAGEHCPFEHPGKGCSIYKRRPFGCHYWNCRWLAEDDTADLPRPDRSHCVIDISPDFVTQHFDDGTPARDVPVIVIWVDPAYPDVHRDPMLRRYLERRGEEGYAALFRYSNSDGMVMFPPAMTNGLGFVEHERQHAQREEHTMQEKLAALGDMKITMVK